MLSTGNKVNHAPRFDQGRAGCRDEGRRQARLAAVRLILAKLKDKDIELRTATSQPDDDVLVVDVLQKMAKQRRESITLYEQGGRQELAECGKGRTGGDRGIPAPADGRGRG
jgi:hypothetical protein